MAEPAADALPPVPHDTQLSDRDLMIHTLQHVESIDDRVGSIDDRLAGFENLLAELGPLIEKARKHGSRGSRLFGSGPPPGGSQG